MERVPCSAREAVSLEHLPGDADLHDRDHDARVFGVLRRAMVEEGGTACGWGDGRCAVRGGPVSDQFCGPRAVVAVSELRRDRWNWPWPGVHYSDLRAGEVVPGPSRSDDRHCGRRFWRWRADYRPAGDAPDPDRRRVEDLCHSRHYLWFHLGDHGPV